MNWNQPRVFAVKHNDLNTRMNSRSGGVFTAFSDKVLENGGIVFGCILDEQFKVCHTGATSTDARNRMRGSKYVQSDMVDVFQKVKKELEDGRQVLFTGTSCQVGGLRAFLQHDYENLLCVDIVCHGVPSPLVLAEYLKWQQKVNKSAVREIDFRNKKDFGWEEHVETVYFENGKKIDSRIYTTLFYGHNVLRPSCFKCPYKDVIHPGDITIADYWGIDKACEGFNDNKGVSLVLINNESGNDFFESIKTQVEYCETELKKSMQPPLEAPFEEPEQRKWFWHDFHKHSFEYIAIKYGGAQKEGLTDKIKRIVKEIIKRNR